MNQGQGLLSKIFAWIWHPSNDDTTTASQWAIGLVAIITLAFLWSTVIKMLIGNK